MDRISTLGWLLCPLRKPTVIGKCAVCAVLVQPTSRFICSLACATRIAEKWSPIEVAVFEAAITLYGKNFNMIQKYVRLCLCVCK
jgi:hypothetical protein